MDGSERGTRPFVKYTLTVNRVPGNYSRRPETCVMYMQKAFLKKYFISD
jgi:hypothetical protein